MLGQGIMYSKRSAYSPRLRIDLGSTKLFSETIIQPSKIETIIQPSKIETIIQPSKIETNNSRDWNDYDESESLPIIPKIWNTSRDKLVDQSGTISFIPFDIKLKPYIHNVPLTVTKTYGTFTLIPFEIKIDTVNFENNKQTKTINFIPKNKKNTIHLGVNPFSILNKV